jgi:O-antigen/teichoic acid export membrane protein
VKSKERLTTETTEGAESLNDENLRGPSVLRGESFSAITFRHQAFALFVLDGLANVIDFAFHFWMGRVLIPADFAVLQTLNSIALVYVTASGVFQPVVGRFIAEARGRGEENVIPAIFQSFLRAALSLGTMLSILLFAFSTYLSQVFNLPPWTIQLSSALIFLSTFRPIAAGTLQGQERFLAFGFTRLALSLGRILLVVLFIPTGITLTVAIAALPFGWLVSVLCAFLLIGSPLWKKVGKLLRNVLLDGWKLSAYTLLSYVAYMSITSLDLVWVNRSLDSDSAGAYASLVLMRRIVALLPGVAATVMFPRIVKILAQGRSPNRLLGQTALVILAAGGALTTLYFLLADPLLSIIFKNQYQAAASLLGPMGFAMIGVSLSSIWLNYYLAEHPRNFVILLLISVVLEWALLNLLPPSLQNAILAFGLTGWSLSLGGLILYKAGLRRRAIAASHSVPFGE